MLAVMTRTDPKRSTVDLSAQRVPRRARVRLVPRADGERIAAPGALPSSTARNRLLRRLTNWLVANDGVSERFSVERQRDQELIRRVERRLRQRRDFM